MNRVNRVHGMNRFLSLAREIASWSKDPGTKVGCVIVGKKGQIVSQGYNGFPRGFSDTPERLMNRDLKLKYTIHAEANALYNALWNGASVDGCTLYVHGLPVCAECAKAIIQSGISKVVYDSDPKPQWKESADLALSMFKEANIEIEKHNSDIFREIPDKEFDSFTDALNF